MMKLFVTEKMSYLYDIEKLNELSLEDFKRIFKVAKKNAYDEGFIIYNYFCSFVWWGRKLKEVDIDISPEKQKIAEKLLFLVDPDTKPELNKALSLFAFYKFKLGL